MLSINIFHKIFYTSNSYNWHDCLFCNNFCQPRLYNSYFHQYIPWPYIFHTIEHNRCSCSLHSSYTLLKMENLVQWIKCFKKLKSWKKKKTIFPHQAFFHVIAQCAVLHSPCAFHSLQYTSWSAHLFLHSLQDTGQFFNIQPGFFWHSPILDQVAQNLKSIVGII